MNGFDGRPKSLVVGTTLSETTSREASWRDFGTSMNAVSFGFLATAILISMFLIIAIFELLLRSRPSLPQSQNDAQGSSGMGQEQAQMHTLGKLRSSEAVTSPYPSDFSVLMPGQKYPTYLAQPAPLPCSREGIYWPPHNHHAFASS